MLLLLIILFCFILELDSGVLKITSWSPLRCLSWQCSGGSVGCQGQNLGQLYARKMPSHCTIAWASLFLFCWFFPISHIISSKSHLTWGKMTFVNSSEINSFINQTMLRSSLKFREAEFKYKLHVTTCAIIGHPMWRLANIGMCALLISVGESKCVSSFADYNEKYFCIRVLCLDSLGAAMQNSSLSIFSTQNSDYYQFWMYTGWNGCDILFLVNICFLRQ